MIKRFHTLPWNLLKRLHHDEEGSLGIAKSVLDDVPVPSTFAGSFLTARVRGLQKNQNSSSVTSQSPIGYATTGISASGTSSQNAPTATEPANLTVGTTASASTLATGIGESFANPANFTFKFFQRFQARIAFNQSSNARYWISVGAPGASLPFASMASDAPAFALIGFRYSPSSAGDTTIKCIGESTTGGVGGQTLRDSSIVPALGVSMLFEMAFDGVNNFTFFINRKLVATIAQGSANNAPTFSDQALVQIVCDNLNTANAANFNWAFHQVWESQ